MRHLPHYLAATEEKMVETGKVPATLLCGGNTSFNEGTSEVMFSEGRTQEELCSLPAASYTDRAMRVSLSAPGPAANLTKCFLVFAKRKRSVCSCSSRCWLPGSPWQPGVSQVSNSALEKWFPSQIQSMADRLPWREDNDCAGFYGP